MSREVVRVATLKSRVLILRIVWLNDIVRGANNIPAAAICQVFFIGRRVSFAGLSSRQIDLGGLSGVAENWFYGAALDSAEANSDGSVVRTSARSRI